MEIFSHSSNSFRADFDELIDRAEDPVKMVEQIIRDAETELQDALQRLSRASANEHVAAVQLEDARRKSADWKNRARNAIAAQDTELARSMLTEKIRADEAAASCQEIYETIAAQTQTARTMAENIRSWLPEARQRQSLLRAERGLPELPVQEQPELAVPPEAQPDVADRVDAELASLLTELHTDGTEA